MFFFLLIFIVCFRHTKSWFFYKKPLVNIHSLSYLLFLHWSSVLTKLFKVGDLLIAFCLRSIVTMFINHMI
ncbi:hypothetical protein HanOQP8_Chr07g0262051 [Helianthus annuus]|nr:hypothetical protein HanOQP8_Chr07g0262051 [Helianthus annuus]